MRIIVRDTKLFHIHALVAGAHPPELKTLANRTEWVGFKDDKTVITFHYSHAHSPRLVDVSKAIVTEVQQRSYNVVILLTKEVLCEVHHSKDLQMTADSLTALEWRSVWEELNTFLAPSTIRIWMPTSRVYKPLFHFFTSVAESRGWWYSHAFELWSVSRPFNWA